MNWIIIIIIIIITVARDLTCSWYGEEKKNLLGKTIQKIKKII
jgi:hypothetical protein